MTSAYPSYIASILVNSLSFIPTVVINLLVVLAIYRTPAIQTPSNILLCSLACTDLTVGLLVQPVYIISRIAEVLNSFELFCSTWLVSRLLASWMANVSLLTLTVVGIDRVLAMHLGMQYRTVVKTSRMTTVAVALWVLAGILSFIRLLTYEVRIFLGVGAAIYISCLLVLCFSYWKTFNALRRHQLKIGDTLHNRQSGSMNVKRYRKSLYTMLYVVGLVLVCYLPYICLALPVVFTGRSEAERAAWTIVDTLLFLNSLLNPILYCWRIRDVRRSLVGVLQKYLPWCDIQSIGTCWNRHVRDTDTRDTKQGSVWRTAPNPVEIKSRNTLERKSRNTQELKSRNTSEPKPRNTRELNWHKELDFRNL